MEATELTKHAIPSFAKHVAEAFPDSFGESVIFKVDRVPNQLSLRLIRCHLQSGPVRSLAVAFDLNEPAMNGSDCERESYLNMRFAEAIDDALIGV